MNKNPSANIVDNSLVLSLPNALNPVVWRMELTKAKMSAIEVQEDKLGDFILTLKTPKGEANEIAKFSAKNDALRGLSAITTAMQKAEKQQDKILRKNAEKKSIAKTALMGSLAAICVIIVLMMGTAVIKTIITINSGGASNVSYSADQGRAINEGGAPVSADDFLKARQ